MWKWWVWIQMEVKWRLSPHQSPQGTYVHCCGLLHRTSDPFSFQSGWNGSFSVAWNYRACCISWHHRRAESNTSVYRLGVCLWGCLSLLLLLWRLSRVCERFLSLSWVWRAFNMSFCQFISTFNSCISLHWLFVIASAFIQELLLDSWILSAESASISMGVVSIIGASICVVVWSSLSSHNSRSIFSDSVSSELALQVAQLLWLSPIVETDVVEQVA